MVKRVLFRPQRLQYVKKQIKVEGCVFCRAAQESPSVENLCLVKTPYSMVVVNKFPYNPGHLLVLPLRHEADLESLNPSEFQDFSALLQRSVKLLKRVYLPAGMNMGMNLGASAGAGIPDHLHAHLVPRWTGDLNFFPLIAETKVVVETAEETYARVKAAFQVD
ncbi:MAG: HIT domain-containing protein [Bdellovibrio sp.]